MKTRIVVHSAAVLLILVSFNSCLIFSAEGECNHSRDGSGPSRTAAMSAHQGAHAAKKIIASDAAPAAIGPYSQAVMTGNTLYLSGQIAIDPETGALVRDGIEKETRRVLDNIGAVLKAAGMDFADVVQVQVFLKDLDHYSKMNSIYAEYFKADFPARAAVQVARLPKDVSIEIMCTAVKGAGKKHQAP
jgi:2-iminobutanoate/2-iminopropanoate deaminase